MKGFRTASQGQRIQLGVCRLLLWLFCLELAEFIPHRSPLPRKILERRSLPLGWYSHVPCCLHLIQRPDGSTILPRSG